MPRAAGPDDSPARQRASAGSAQVVVRGQVGRRPHAIAFRVQPGACASRAGTSAITAGYPEGTRPGGGARYAEAVLDGEIVAFLVFGPRPPPTELRAASEPHTTSSASAAVRRLMRTTPVVYAVFDLIYLDGHSLMERPYSRAPRPLKSRSTSQGPRGACPPSILATGSRLLEATRSRGLEGSSRSGSTPATTRPTQRCVAEDQEHAPPGDGDRRLDPGRGSPDRADRGAADGRPQRTGRSGTRGESGPEFTEKLLDDLLAGASSRCGRRTARSMRRRSSHGKPCSSTRAWRGRGDRVRRVDDRAGDARALVQGAAGRQGRA